MPKPWLGFQTHQGRGSLQPILEHYGLTLERKGAEFDGLCPFH
jgi:hypothetical protein